MQRIAIYGLTTEGFNIAKTLASKNEVYIVDETLQTAFQFGKELQAFGLSQLMNEEPLLELKPVEKILSQANIIFFTPRMRKFGEESLTEASAKVRDVSRYISEGSVMVNCVPTGLGGNSEYIQIIEKQSGLSAGKGFHYCYYPLKPKESSSDIVASTQGCEEILYSLGIRITSERIFAAELEYVSELLRDTLGFISSIEINKKARDSNVKIRQTDLPYLDKMFSRIYDLRAVQAKEDVSETSAYLAGSIIKNLENFSRYLIDAIRDILRDRALKASKTKVIVLWSIDRYEMRPDQILASGSIEQRLRDYVTDVSTLGYPYLQTGIDVLSALKKNIVVLCSKEDAEGFSKIEGRLAKDCMVIHARPDLKIV